MWEYRARAVNVHDGDTLTLLVDLGLTVTATITVRLEGVHAPELKQEGGPQARDYLMGLVCYRDGDWPLIVTTKRVRDDSHEVMTLARYVATIRTSIDGPTTNTLAETYYRLHGWPGGIGS